MCVNSKELAIRLHLSKCHSVLTDLVRSVTVTIVLSWTRILRDRILILYCLLCRQYRKVAWSCIVESWNIIANCVSVWHCQRCDNHERQDNRQLNGLGFCELCHWNGGNQCNWDFGPKAAIVWSDQPIGGADHCARRQCQFILDLDVLEICLQFKSTSNHNN